MLYDGEGLFEFTNIFIIGCYYTKMVFTYLLDKLHLCLTIARGYRIVTFNNVFMIKRPNNASVAS